ncbi:MAG: DUF72 domain-containing protein [Bacteroidota bacterium]
MKFGYLKNIDHVEFQQPLPRQETIDYLQQRETDEQTPKFYIGATGWSTKEWVGQIYPKGTKTTDFLKYYGEQFNSIELNTTHYRIPTGELVEKWKAATPDDFRFCPKIPQSISHRNDFGLSNGLLKRFTDVITELEDRLGCCFMQLPPYFDSGRLPQLEQFMRLFPDHIPLAVEVRHESWFQNDATFQQFVETCRRQNIATVVSDVAGRRDVMHTAVSTDKWVIRFVGNALHPTDYKRVDEWIQLLKIYIKNGLKEIYFFPHQHEEPVVPPIAAYILEQVEKELKILVRGPDVDKYQQGEQMSLF